MTYEKDPFEFEKIPDYALQPAKEADEYNFHYTPRGATSRFDPAAYERVLHDSVRQAAENEEQPEILDIREEKVPNSLEETTTEFFPQVMQEILPAAFAGSDKEAEPTAIFNLREETVFVEPTEAAAAAAEEAAEEEAAAAAEAAVPVEFPDTEEDDIPVFSTPAAT
ncbi:MAG TPA: hypothetical protein VM577_10155, partial [Anaerovoracaceae bacterium]|nr:hypothetical protein [Anaerovoracaceae bacterium]